MEDDRPGVLVCVCSASGRILMHAPYAAEEYRIASARARKQAEKKNEDLDTARV